MLNKLKKLLIVVVGVFLLSTPVFAQVVSQTPLVTRPDIQKITVDQTGQSDITKDVKCGLLSTGEREKLQKTEVSQKK